uniref:Transmembrane protein n=1 Tax=Marseillevirus LCMAC101 TaxID=2506602 RepID=A0A481YT37_9VIRU|nr:MAG: hypothetical protein LCMAC101_07450 [Marseillevirus LCMAC101]
MVSNTFFYALIILSGLVVLFVFLRKGQTCTGCSEGFHQLTKATQPSKEAEYRKKKRKELGLKYNYGPASMTDGKVRKFVGTHQPWPGYDKYSLYSTMVSPRNTDNYPYMDTPYNEIMRSCVPSCYSSDQDQDQSKRCLKGCVFLALAETLPPVQ